ncbi:MAG: M23 family metallopeptidase [Actinomycetes bacterium]
MKIQISAVLAFTLLFISPATQAEEALDLPIEGLVSSDVINQYLGPETPYSAGHRGIDLPAELGTQIVSPATGTVSFVGQVGYRNLISIQFGASNTASLEPVCSQLTEGMTVTIGEPIGLLCDAAPEYQWHCAGFCLHFGTRNERGYFSPLALIGGLAPSRLVP